MSVLEIPATAPGSGLILERRLTIGQRQMQEGNGERELADVLGPGWLYERYEYPLPSGFSFVPDFYRPRRRRRPARHLELTWLDYAISRDEQRLTAAADMPVEEVERLTLGLAELRERWERKQYKVRIAQELYGERYGEFILVTYADYLQLIAGSCSVSDLAA